ncbi:nitrate- and nitrite sensing domain-containing protein [Actinokineospora soli]|uniref:histidine kinase n=1 Tax=Actinokineospora soli TaxID=1048753 RepID=A0ABW2TUH1_9PSEU
MSGTESTTGGTGAGTGGGEAVASRWSALTRWRDWNLPVKLSAIVLVPVVFAIVLGALTIAGQIERADSFRRVDRVVAVNDDLRKVLTWLQRERTKAATLLTGGSRDISFELTAEQRSADAARANLVRSVERAEFAGAATADRYAAVGARFTELDALRARVAERDVNGAEALSGYTAVIHSLLAFDRAAAEEIADPGLSGTAGALHDLEAAKEEVYYQQALVAMGIARGGLSGAELEALRASQARLDAHVAEFRSVATPAQLAEFDRMLDAPGVTTRLNLLRLVLGDESETLLPVGVPLPITSVDWNGASELTSGRISNVSGTLGREITTRSAALQDEASDGAGLASVVLTVALVLAAFIIISIGRPLLRSLELLRREAMKVAEESLPAAVERIRGGKDVPAEPEIVPVPITTGDEVGAVARAFDAIHRQALRLATEQAGLRANYSDVFVNLSRRSQGLVQRQLHLLEQLERDEEDADQLAVLFQLDHLATRMRRNNENLMVLSGSDPARRGSLPASLADLLRAAVSEIEQYQRVVIQPPADVQVVGYAVGDLIRLVAELLDNATAFSAPATQVAVSSHHSPGGQIRVEIADRGIGLPAAELAEANARLADSGAVDASTSRRMGLFVVGRLAARLGVKVWLEPAVGQGLRAIITVPAELCATPEPARVPVPTPTPAPRPPADPEPLPRRANGHSNGHATNGSTANGSANGTNGHATNGHATNGHATNGHTANGHSNGADPLGPWNPAEITSVDGPSTADLLNRLSPGDGASLPDRPVDTVAADPVPARGRRRSPPGAARPAGPRRCPAASRAAPPPSRPPSCCSPRGARRRDRLVGHHPRARAHPAAARDHADLRRDGLRVVPGGLRPGRQGVGLRRRQRFPHRADGVVRGGGRVHRLRSAPAHAAAQPGARQRRLPPAPPALVRPARRPRPARPPVELPARRAPGARGAPHRARARRAGRARPARRPLAVRRRLRLAGRGRGRQRGPRRHHHDRPAPAHPARAPGARQPRRGRRAAGAAPGVARDAEALRSRLAGFQRGLDRGRDSLAQRGAPAGAPSGSADHEGDGDA